MAPGPDLSNEVLVTLCGMRSRRQVAEIERTARVAVMNDFVPMNLGFNDTSRGSIVDRHITDISTQLFTNPISDNLILVLYGTFINIQKGCLTSSDALHSQYIKNP